MTFLYVQRLTSAEKEVEKKWIDEQIGFQGKMWEGWVMYDGTIVILYKKPGLSGNAYYTRKGNYGLNAQVSLCLYAFPTSVKICADWKHTLKSANCWLLTWNDWVSSLCNSLWTYHSCKISRLVFWRRRICLGWFCICCQFPYMLEFRKAVWACTMCSFFWQYLFILLSSLFVD